MFKPVPPHDDIPHGETPHDHAERKKKRRLRRVSMLPTLLTLGNLCFGFAAIYACSLEMYDLGKGIEPSSKLTLSSVFFEAKAPTYLSIGFWLLVGSCLCDALDGRVARKTGASSKFGEQLDSLADVVSFGLAPALMMVTLVHREFGGMELLGFVRMGQFSAMIAIIYLSCTALRLARFTVETSQEEAVHDGFRGLPSPGAASALVTLMFLHEYLVMGEWFTVGRVIAYSLPWVTLALALLMVSRMPYRHFVSSLLRRRPLEHVVVILLAVPLIWIFTEYVVTVAAWVFVLHAPIRAALGRARSESLSESDDDREGEPSVQDYQRKKQA